MTALLRLEAVGRRFGGLTALHDITLHLEAGGCHAVIGPNGAGKSTLLNLIAGTIRPSGGSVIFDSHNITRISAPRRARLGIGRTFQHPALFARLTVAANLSLALTHPRHAPLFELVEGAGLTAHADIPAGQLPYGLQRRLELAMALAPRPRLLLLDEPSAGLDPDEITRLAAQLHDLAADTTVLLVDHNLHLVWSLADTVTVLHHGRHLATGSPDQIRRDPHVHDAYLSGGHPPPTRPAGRTVAGPVLLRVRDLRAGYHGTPVVSGIDLDVHEGEAVAVLGRNGAGKTTLLAAIAGLLSPRPPSSVDFAGRPLPTRYAHQPARAGLAIVPQGRRLFGPLTVTEHLTCAYTAHHHSHPTIRPQWTPARVLEVLPALAERAHHPAGRLSGGEQQMLALARALLTNPRLLLLDEPSEGLAPAVIGHLTTTLAALVADGLAVLIAEQNLPLANAISDRVMVLDHGRIALSVATAGLTEPVHQQRINALLGVADPTDPQPEATR